MITWRIDCPIPKTSEEAIQILESFDPKEMSSAHYIQAYKKFPMFIQENHDVVKKLIDINHFCYIDLPDSVKQNKPLNKFLLETSVAIFDKMHFFHDDREMVDIAISKNGHFISVANKKFRQDKELLYKAIKTDRASFKYLNSVSPEDKVFMLNCIKENPDHIGYMNPNDDLFKNIDELMSEVSFSAFVYSYFGNSDSEKFKKINEHISNPKNASYAKVVEQQFLSANGVTMLEFFEEEMPYQSKWESLFVSNLTNQLSQLLPQWEDSSLNHLSFLLDKLCLKLIKEPIINCVRKEIDKRSINPILLNSSTNTVVPNIKKLRKLKIT
jgi:hypothetical protein